MTAPILKPFISTLSGTFSFKSVWHVKKPCTNATLSFPSQCIQPSLSSPFLQCSTNQNINMPYDAVATFSNNKSRGHKPAMRKEKQTEKNGETNITKT